jgi:hypothetical protein
MKGDAVVQDNMTLNGLRSSETSASLYKNTQFYVPETSFFSH